MKWTKKPFVWYSCLKLAIFYTTSREKSKIKLEAGVDSDHTNATRSNRLHNYGGGSFLPSAMEGNVFTGVCLSTWPLDIRPGGTPPPQTLDLGYPSPYYNIWWSSLETCPNLFTEGPIPLPQHHQYWHLEVANATCTFGKRALRILLECCLVFGQLSQGNENNLI